MDIEDRIETPENVELRRKLAGIGLRFQAGLLDTLILTLAVVLPIAAVFFFFLSTAEFMDNSTLEMLTMTVMILFVFCVYWGYFLVFELFKNGQTPGKKYMKIRVVRQEGQSLTFQAVFVRNLLRIVDGIGAYAIAGISMFFSQKVQRLGDIAAGTVVISEQVTDYSAAADSKQHVFIDENIAAAVLDQSGIKPEEFRLLYNYWMRKDQLDPAAKARLLPKILTPIFERRGHSLQSMPITEMEYTIEQTMSAIRHRINQADSNKTASFEPEKPSSDESIS